MRNEQGADRLTIQGNLTDEKRWRMQTLQALERVEQLERRVSALAPFEPTELHYSLQTIRARLKALEHLAAGQPARLSKSPPEMPGNGRTIDLGNLLKGVCTMDEITQLVREARTFARNVSALLGRMNVWLAGQTDVSPPIEPVMAPAREIPAQRNGYAAPPVPFAPPPETRSAYPMSRSIASKTSTVASRLLTWPPASACARPKCIKSSPACARTA